MILYKEGNALQLSTLRMVASLLTDWMWESKYLLRYACSFSDRTDLLFVRNISILPFVCLLVGSNPHYFPDFPITVHTDFPNVYSLAHRRQGISAPFFRGIFRIIMLEKYCQIGAIP